MKRMGFNNNQISVILESSKKKAEELQRIANEKAFLGTLSIPANVLVDEWTEESKSLNEIHDLLTDINENEIYAQLDMNNIVRWLGVVRSEIEKRLQPLIEKTVKDRTIALCENTASLFEAVQEGVVSYQQLADFLYEYAEIKIEADWLKGESEDE
jgi:hypothetical protein